MLSVSCVYNNYAGEGVVVEMGVLREIAARGGLKLTTIILGPYKAEWCAKHKRRSAHKTNPIRMRGEP